MTVLWWEDQTEFWRAFVTLLLSSFSQQWSTAVLEPSVWFMSSCPPCEPTLPAGLMAKGGHFANRFPFTAVLAGSTERQLLSGTSVPGTLYWSPEIKMTIRARLRAAVVCPSSRIRDGFGGVRENRKCIFDKQRDIPHCLKAYAAYFIVLH